MGIPSLKVTAKSYLKHCGWKIRSFPFGAFRPIFRRENVTFQGGVTLKYDLEKFLACNLKFGDFLPFENLGPSLKTNIFAPQNRRKRPKRKGSNLPTRVFQVRTVSFRQGICFFVVFGGLEPDVLGFNGGTPKNPFLPFIFGDPFGIQNTGPQATKLTLNHADLLWENSKRPPTTRQPSA